MEVVKYCTGKVNNLVWQVKLIQKKPCSKAECYLACLKGYPNVGTGGCPWLPHLLRPGWEHSLEMLPRIFRSCCWSPHLLQCKETPRVWEIVYSSHPASLTAEGSAQQTERRMQPLHLSTATSLTPCLALCALSMAQNIPDPIATKQVAPREISPCLGFEWCAGRLGWSSDGPELPSASPCILGDSVC